MLGVMATINQELDKDSIELIAGEYGVEVEEEVVVDDTAFESLEIIDDEKTFKCVLQLLQSWVTLTTVKRRFLTLSVTQK